MEAKAARAEATAKRASAEALDARADLLDREAVRHEEPHGDADPLVSWCEEGLPRETFLAACKSESGGIAGARLVGRQFKAPRSSVRAWVASLPTERTQTAKSDAPEAPLDDLDRLLARARRTA